LTNSSLLGAYTFRCAVSLWSVEKLDQGQKPEGAGSDASHRRNVLGYIGSRESGFGVFGLEGRHRPNLILFFVAAIIILLIFAWTYIR
jgi:hypothetical protein